MRNPWLAVALLAVSPLSAHAAETAEHGYQAARRAYYALKRDPARRKRRDAWLSVAHKFEAVASRFPKSDRTPDALFTAGQLLGELSRISFVSEDLDASLTDYRKLVELHPRHRLADDAALALAHAQLDRLNEPDAARRTLQQALQKLPHGDRFHSLKALLASIPASEERDAAPVVATRERPVAQGRPTPNPTRAAEADSGEGEDEETPPPPAPVAAPAPKERLKALARQKDAELSLGEQLGLKVRRVVIDAGHGGHDSGTVGAGGTREKDVALGIAKRLARDLEAQGLSVVLTRDDDRFVRLEDRARIANQAKGDLFISIHCNSAPQHYLRGIETYTLNTASDRYSIRLAARENQATERGVSDLQFILADLATKANTEESARLASRVQKGLVDRLSTKYSDIHDLGNKEALFYVLLGAKMPAILVETSFLSNAEDERRLASKAYQEDVAQAIAGGVQDFLGYRERLAKMD